MLSVAYETNAGMAVLAAWGADVNRCSGVSCCFLFSPGPFFDGFVGDLLFTFLQQAQIQGRWNGWIFTPPFSAPPSFFFSYPSNIDWLYYIVTKIHPPFQNPGSAPASVACGDGSASCCGQPQCLPSSRDRFPRLSEANKAYVKDILEYLTQETRNCCHRQAKWSSFRIK